MRPVPLPFVLALTLAGSGCVATATVEPPPPPPTVRVEADPNPVPVRIEPEPVEVIPVEPPPTPRLRIAQRSVYESDRTAVWRLENGLTVVYAWDDGAADYAYRVSQPRSQRSSPAEATVQVGRARTGQVGQADRLDDALDRLAEALAGGGTVEAVALLSGPLGWEWVEPGVATVLGGVRRSDPGRGASQAAVAQVEAGWADYPALWVVGALVQARLRAGDEVALTVDPASGTASLSGPVPDYALAPALDDEVRRARDAAREPAARLTALDALFQLPGSFRPARPVSDARALADRVAAVSPQAVNQLLARLARAAP